jgi:2-oxoisovalerate dehydrogenase E1 component
MTVQKEALLEKLVERGLHPRERVLKVLETLLLTRFMDEKMAKLVRQNKGATFHLAVSGHELIGAISALSLTPGKDWGFPYYRDRAFAIGLGCTPKDLLASFLARDIPNHSGGRMMPEHFSQVNLRIPCQSSCVGSQFLQAVGTAKSAVLRGEKEVIYVSGGDGSTSQGDFHEMLNFACLHNLPLVIVIQDNGWAISVPVKDQTAGGTIAKMARGYEGLAVFEIDGTDYLATSGALEKAVAKARVGLGPSLVVAHVPRLSPHSSSDDPKKYQCETVRSVDKLRDPIPRFEKWLLDQNYLTATELELYRREVVERIEAASQAADQIPTPLRSSATANVFKPFLPVGTPSRDPNGDSIVLMDAINHALIEEMERDPGVIVFGQDVAKGKGGVFGITRTLTDRFGENRCFNTPLAESTIIALATGLSFDGFHKPVAEIQFADYAWTGMNQLFNELSSMYYRSNGQWNCPVVIRMPYGGYIQGGPYHSQSTEAFLCHCPGLKVVIPSNAADAKRLMKTAIRDPNPVIFLEHKALYRQRIFSARPETGPDDLLPFGQAAIAKAGDEITVAAWGMGVLMAMEAAETLSKEGISVEVIDLRTLVPLDFDSILASVKKTGKFIVFHEAPRNCGFGAELAARVAEEAFLFLDAPVRRVAGKDCPVPYCKDLEEEVLPKVKDLEDALRSLAAY